MSERIGNFQYKEVTFALSVIAIILSSDEWQFKISVLNRKSKNFFNFILEIWLKLIKTYEIVIGVKKSEPEAILNKLLLVVK